MYDWVPIPDLVITPAGVLVLSRETKFEYTRILVARFFSVVDVIGYI